MLHFENILVVFEILHADFIMPFELLINFLLQLFVFSLELLVCSDVILVLLFKIFIDFFDFGYFFLELFDFLIDFFFVFDILIFKTDDECIAEVLRVVNDVGVFDLNFLAFLVELSL